MRTLPRDQTRLRVKDASGGMSEVRTGKVTVTKNRQTLLTDKLLAVCADLEAAGLPTPSSQCGACKTGTFYRKDSLFQCPDCGALSTAFGGTFTHNGPASADWIAACTESKAQITAAMEITNLVEQE